MKTTVRIAVVFAALMFVSDANADVREDWNTTADAIEKLGGNDAAERVRKSIESLPDDVLEKVYGDINLTNLANQITALEKSVNSNKYLRAEYMSLTQRASSTPANYVSLNQETESSVESGIEPVSSSSAISNGFPSAIDYPSPLWCSASPKVFSSSDVQNFHQVVVDARAGYSNAKSAWDAASRLCDQVTVLVGEGGNTSLGCIPVDIIFAVIDITIRTAENVLEKMELCNDTVNSAEINGSYERIGYLYSTVVADDADIMQSLNNHDVAIKQVLGKHDDDMKQKLTAHDTDIKQKITNHDADVKQKISSHDEDMKQALNKHDEEVKQIITTHDTDMKQALSKHDEDMKQALNKHDEEIKNILKIVDNKLDIITERQLEVIRLLHTPEGNRSTDVPACHGAPCSYPNKSK